MPKLLRVPAKQSEKYPYVAEYECTCGKGQTYYGDGPPKRFRDLLCFDCQSDLGNLEEVAK